MSKAPAKKVTVKKTAVKEVTAVFYLSDFEEQMHTYFNRALEAMRTFPGTSGDRWHVTSPLSHLRQYVEHYQTVLECYGDDSVGARRRRDNAGKKLDELYKRTEHWSLFVAYRDETDRAKKLKLMKAHTDAEVASAAARAGMSVRAYRAKCKAEHEAYLATENARKAAVETEHKARLAKRTKGGVLV